MVNDAEALAPARLTTWCRPDAARRHPTGHSLASGLGLGQRADPEDAPGVDAGSDGPVPGAVAGESLKAVATRNDDRRGGHLLHRPEALNRHSVLLQLEPLAQGFRVLVIERPNGVLLQPVVLEPLLIEGAENSKHLVAVHASSVARPPGVGQRRDTGSANQRFPTSNDPSAEPGDLLPATSNMGPPGRL